MENFFYTVTPELKEKLENLKKLHDSVTLTLITPKDEVKAQWEATLNRITHSILVNGTHTSKTSVIRILRPNKTKRNSAEEKLVAAYKQAYDHARQTWYASDNRLNEESLRAIIRFFVTPQLSTTHDKLEHMLSFVQIPSEHPIVQASLCHALIQINKPFNDGNQHLATIIPYIFLYKHGYFFRNMLDLEEYKIQNKQTYEDCLKTIKESNNLSGIIEFYTNAILKQTEQIQTKLQEKKFDTEQSDSFFHLTDRQKQILALFDEPGLRLTNRKVQELFDVSQITASRDLAKLAELNLLFSSGKGRSVFYTKI